METGRYGVDGDLSSVDDWRNRGRNCCLCAGEEYRRLSGLHCSGGSGGDHSCDYIREEEKEDKAGRSGRVKYKRKSVLYYL